MGPSGSGKTSLLNALANHVPANSGMRLTGVRAWGARVRLRSCGARRVPGACVVSGGRRRRLLLLAAEGAGATLASWLLFGDTHARTHARTHPHTHTQAA
jgi:GTPase SAR1 family protein